MESFDEVKDFFDYLIIGDNGWEGVRPDAPQSAKDAYHKYVQKQKEYEKDGIRS